MLGEYVLYDGSLPRYSYDFYREMHNGWKVQTMIVR